MAGEHLHARSYPKDSFILITTCRSTSNSFVEVIICSCLISKHLPSVTNWDMNQVGVGIVGGGLYRKYLLLGILGQIHWDYIIPKDH